MQRALSRVSVRGWDINEAVLNMMVELGEDWAVEAQQCL